MSGNDYAEPAVYTSTAYCLTCGPVLRGHMPNGLHVTYHTQREAARPNGDATMPEEDRPPQ